MIDGVSHDMHEGIDDVAQYLTVDQHLVAAHAEARGFANRAAGLAHPAL